MTQKMDILVNEELLKDKLSQYREICPVLLDIFLWRKEVYPLMLAAGVSCVFGLLYYSDPSVITALSLIGLVFTLADFICPVLYTHTVKTSEGWSTEKEKKFCILANQICYASVLVWNLGVDLEERKRANPNVYSAAIVSALVFLAWFGNAVHNLLIAYLLALVAVLLPGLLHRRLPQMYVSRLIVAVAKILGIKSKST